MCFGLGGATTVNKAESFEEHDENVGRRKEDFQGLKSRLKKLPFPCQSLFIKTINLVKAKLTNTLQCQNNFIFENEG